jgi:hypothetical protein
MRRMRRCVLTAVACVAALALSGCSHASHSAYGGLPSFLPTTSLQPDSVLTGTSERPALTAEGDAVLVQLPAGSVQATVSGPVVPGEGLPYQTDATTCTWTVTLTGASAQVPISVADFSTLDHLGTTYHPTFVTAPPAMLAPGQRITFQLRAVMRVGEGLMRWSPGMSGYVASWDFEVEID